MTQPENAADHPRSKPTVSECKKTKKLAGIDMFDMSDTRTDRISYLLISQNEPLGARLPDFRFLYVNMRTRKMGVHAAHMQTFADGLVALLQQRNSVQTLEVSKILSRTCRSFT